MDAIYRCGNMCFFAVANKHLVFATAKAGKRTNRNCGTCEANTKLIDSYINIYDCAVAKKRVKICVVQRGSDGKCEKCGGG